MNSTEQLRAEYEKLFEIKMSNEEAKKVLEIFLNMTEITEAELYIFKQAVKRELKENKEMDQKCSKLEEKEAELINQNEYYEDLIYALENYYAITEEDLKERMYEK